MPERGAIDVFKIDSLATWILVVRVVPLAREPRHALQVMLDGQGYVGLLRNISGIFNYSPRVSTYIVCFFSVSVSAYEGERVGTACLPLLPWLSFSHCNENIHFSSLS